MVDFHRRTREGPSFVDIVLDYCRGCISFQRTRNNLLEEDVTKWLAFKMKANYSWPALVKRINAVSAFARLDETCEQYSMTLPVLLIWHPKPLALPTD